MQAEPLKVDGSRPAVEWVAAIPDGWITGGEWRVLMAMACDSRYGKTTMPGYENLAAWTHLHRSSVVEIVAALQSKNDRRPALIEIEKRGRGRGQRTVFRLLLPVRESDRLASPSGKEGSVSPTDKPPLPVGLTGHSLKPISPKEQSPSPTGNPDRPVDKCPEHPWQPRVGCTGCAADRKARRD